jgi:hypothetical protein
MKKLIAVGVIAMAGLSVGGSAFAGEVGGPKSQGNGPKATVGIFEGEGAQSICAFSGQNDVPTDPIEGGRTQNWGSIPKAVRDQLAAEGEHPGVACNGHSGIIAQVTGG